MKVPLILLLIGFSLIRVLGQNSFEYTFDKYSSWCYSAFESGNYYYAMGITSWEGTGKHAFISRFTNGSDIETKEIAKQDTSSLFYFGIPKSNGNILLIGKIFNLQNQYQQLFSCEMTNNLEIVNETYYSIMPNGYHSLDMYDMVVDQDSNLILAGHFDSDTTDYSLVLVKINPSGELIGYNNLVSIWYSGYQWADLLIRKDGNGYYYFSGGSYSWVKIDSQFQFLSGGFFYPQQIGLPVTAKYLPDGSIAFVGQNDVGTSYYDIVLNILTDDLQWVYDTAIVEPGRQCPAIFKGMDYIDPENIWIVAFNDWIAPTGTEVYKFYIFDSEFNVKGSKYFGGDNEYTFTYLKATSDGGCIVTGMIRREEGSTSRGAIIKKVMPEDILTGDDEKIFTDFKDVLVYPNPFNDKVYLKTDRNDLTFNLFNTLGQLVYQGIITDRIKNGIDIGNLKKGIYIYSITNRAGKAIDGGKMLKK